MTFSATGIISKSSFYFVLFLTIILVPLSGAHAASGNQILIKAVYPDCDARTLTIVGDNLQYRDKIPEVTLGDETLELISYNPAVIEANLPASFVTVPGDYLLTVTARVNSKHTYDAFLLTIGADGADCPFTEEQSARLTDLYNCAYGRFCDMRDGTIRDNQTGLIWLKDAGAFGQMDWNEANLAVDRLNSGEHGLSDGSVEGEWRQPRKAEWEAFIDTSYNNPALCNTEGTAQWTPGDAFVDVHLDIYWSDTYLPHGVGRCYVFSMEDGIIGDIAATDLAYVWPVRYDN